MWSTFIRNNYAPGHERVAKFIAWGFRPAKWPDIKWPKKRPVTVSQTHAKRDRNKADIGSAMTLERLGWLTQTCMADPHCTYLLYINLENVANSIHRHGEWSASQPAAFGGGSFNRFMCDEWKNEFHCVGWRAKSVGRGIAMSILTHHRTLEK